MENNKPPKPLTWDEFLIALLLTVSLGVVSVWIVEMVIVIVERREVMDAPFIKTRTQRQPHPSAFALVQETRTSKKYDWVFWKIVDAESREIIKWPFATKGEALRRAVSIALAYRDYERRTGQRE